MEKTVVELFAGVGGFRVGFNNISAFDKDGRALENGPFRFVWANQWEPSTIAQHAYDCYRMRFPNEPSSNVDIAKIDKASIPDHSILCGGFPCQDYSVAHTLSQAKGIEGKKGVLWWQINDILKAKKPAFVLLENVDRLLKSPAKQRGRDFGIMLRCLADLGYGMEWRVINAADYGHPQRRRRTFIFAFRNDTVYYKRFSKLAFSDIFEKEGIFAKCFPVNQISSSDISHINVKQGYSDLVEVSDKFHAAFCNSGFMINGGVHTVKLSPVTENPITLREIIQRDVDERYFLNDSQKAKFEFLRGSKKIARTDDNGFEYFYTEGAMSPYDELDLPARTMLTSEGTVNRSTHIIMDPDKGRLRFLTPVECERINQFPDNWTDTGMPLKRRYFMMGNALVTGIINKLSLIINLVLEDEP